MFTSSWYSRKKEADSFPLLQPLYTGNAWAGEVVSFLYKIPCGRYDLAIKRTVSILKTHHTEWSKTRLWWAVTDPLHSSITYQIRGQAFSSQWHHWTITDRCEIYSTINNDCEFFKYGQYCYNGAANFIICTLPYRADNILYRDFKSVCQAMNAEYYLTILCLYVINLPALCSHNTHLYVDEQRHTRSQIS